jgi:predicted anti-sigma-YlaC factor YlaD
MHRLIQDHLEEVLAESSHSLNVASPAAAHLAECPECRDEVSAMRRQASMLRAMRASGTTPEPRPGFYARVMERIEQRPASIWELFFDSAFARRIAVASMALAFLFGVYLVSSERYAEQPVVIGIAASPTAADDQMISANGLPDRDAVLVNLVTYREQ